MKIAGEFVEVAHVPRDETGTKVEAEEQPAREVTPTPVEANAGSSALAPGEAAPVGTMRGSIVVETTAGDMAQDTATRCDLCDHFRHDDWLKHLAAIADTKEGQRQIDKLRGTLLGYALDTTDEDGVVHRREIEPEDLLRINMAIRDDFGICVAFTESTGMVTACAHYGGCPADDPRFKMRDRSAQRIASAGYDRILRLAQGRKE